MTRLAPSLALLAAVGLLAACGKSDTTGLDRQASPPGARAPSVPRALALARAVNLTAADVPGFVASSEQKEHESPAEKRLRAKLDRACIPISTTPLAEAGSPNFQRRARLASGERAIAK